jgi:hypothetical protein
MSLNQFKEEDFYKNLANYLKVGDFMKFRDLIENSNNYDFHLDPKLIPDRFNIVSNLLFNCLRNVPGDPSYLGKLIEIIRDCNHLNILEKRFSKEENRIINEAKTDKIFLLNLNDLYEN